MSSPQVPGYSFSNDWIDSNPGFARTLWTAHVDRFAYETGLTFLCANLPNGRALAVNRGDAGLHYDVTKGDDAVLLDHDDPWATSFKLFHVPRRPKLLDESGRPPSTGHAFADVLEAAIHPLDVVGVSSQSASLLDLCRRRVDVAVLDVEGTGTAARFLAAAPNAMPPCRLRGDADADAETVVLLSDTAGSPDLRRALARAAEGGFALDHSIADGHAAYLLRREASNDRGPVSVLLRHARPTGRVEETATRARYGVVQDLRNGARR